MAENAEHRQGMIFNTDAPEHTRLRRIVTRPFTVRRIDALRPVVQRITDELIDTMLAGPKPADLVTALALPLPSQLISALLGVPYEDHDFFQHNSSVAVDRNATAEQNLAASGALIEYLVRLVDTKRTDPADDVLSDLAQRVDAGEITASEAALLGLQLLVAGHETSANMISLGTLLLLDRPDQLAVLRDADDPQAIADATEEMLRYLSIASNAGQRRIALADIEIAGEVIRAGEGIIMDVAAANWDLAVFPEPERLDLRRAPRRHHAFGFGSHQCVGQQLARAELQIVYGTLYRRIPTLRLATALADIEFKRDTLAYGVYRLPVTW